MLPGNHEYYGGYDISAHLAELKEPIRKNVWLVNIMLLREVPVWCFTHEAQGFRLLFAGIIFFHAGWMLLGGSVCEDTNRGGVL